MKSRIISACTLVLFMAAVVIFNRSFPLALNIMVACIAVLAIYELYHALGMNQQWFLLGPSLLFAGALPFLEPCFFLELTYFAYTVVVFTVLIIQHKHFTFREVGILYSMTLLVPTALKTLVAVRRYGGEHGMFYVIIAIFAAWVADVGAFVAGSLWGKHKLCPNISPKKTIEGAIGGFVLDIAAMLVFGAVFQAAFYSVMVSYLPLFIIGAGGAALSILGDLSFSLIKRSCHIKDFSELIPGHGGVMDRFDSVVFVAPFVLLVVRMLPIIC